MDTGACTEIDHGKDLLCLKTIIVRTCFVCKWSGYTHKPCFQMLILAKFLAATPMLYLGIFHLFSNILRRSIVTGLATYVVSYGVM